MEHRLRITKWHFGKLVLLWAWGLALIVMLLIALESIRENYVLGSLVILGIVTAPVILSVITWIWLGGKEA
jgi:hypothetical protein